MSVINKNIAETHLKAWLDAELAVTTGQSYKIGSRELRRADLREIRESINFWSKKLKELSLAEKRKSKRRVIGVVPRDL